MRTYLNLYCRDSLYEVNVSLLAEILEHSGVATINWMCLHNQPLHWNHDEGFYKEVRNLSSSQCIEELRISSPTVAVISPAESAWAEELAGDIKKIPKSISDGVVTDAPIFVWGEATIRDYYEAKTAAQTRFQIALGGDGAPNDGLEYVQYLREMPLMKEMINWLESKTGKKWDLLITLSG